MPQIQNIFAIIGFSIIDGVNEPNTAFVVPTLKPFADRVGAANSAQALIAQVFARGPADPHGERHPVQPAADHRTVDDRWVRIPARSAGGQEPAAMGSVMQGLVAAANQDPRLSRVFSTYTANNPSIFLDIDREKAQALGLSINDVFTTLQATLGGVYINNFNLFGRAWQVNIQGEAADRRDVSSLWQIYIRNKFGDDVPLRSIANARIVAGPQVITRYNNYRSIPINGGPAPGTPPARHWRRWRKFRPRPCPRATASNGPEPPIRSSRLPARPARSSGWRCYSHSCFSSGFTKAG